MGLCKVIGDVYAGSSTNSKELVGLVDLHPSAQHQLAKQKRFSRRQICL